MSVERHLYLVVGTQPYQHGPPATCLPSIAAGLCHSVQYGSALRRSISTEPDSLLRPLQQSIVLRAYVDSEAIGHHYNGSCPNQDHCLHFTQCGDRILFGRRACPPVLQRSSRATCKSRTHSQASGLTSYVSQDIEVCVPKDAVMKAAEALCQTGLFIRKYRQEFDIYSEYQRGFPGLEATQWTPHPLRVTLFSDMYLRS